MRILLGHNVCAHGGIESWMLLHARGLRAQGHEVECFFYEDRGRLSELRRELPAHIGSPLDLLRLVEGRGFEIAHVSSQMTGAELVGLLAPKTKLVVSCRGCLVLGWNSQNCHVYSSVSPEWASKCQKYSDLRIDVVTNAVCTSRFSPPTQPGSGPPVVCWIGRASDLVQKDFPRFLRICEHLRGSGVELWVADGSGTRPSDWFHVSPMSSAAVQRWERVPHGGMPEFLRQIAARGGVVVSTARWEGWCNTAMEAAACGVWTVAPRVSGLLGSVVDGVTGVHYDPEVDDEIVASTVLDALCPPTRVMNRISACAAAAAERFSAEAMTERYLELYRRDRQLLLASPERRLREGVDGAGAAARRDEGHGVTINGWKRADQLHQLAVDLIRERETRQVGTLVQGVARHWPRYYLRPSRLGQLVHAWTSSRAPA